MQDDQEVTARRQELGITPQLLWIYQVRLLLAVLDIKRNKVESQISWHLAAAVRFAIALFPWAFPVVMVVVNAYTCQELPSALINQNQSAIETLVMCYGITLLSTLWPANAMANWLISKIGQNDVPITLFDQINIRAILSVVSTITLIGGGIALRLAWSCL